MSNATAAQKRLWTRIAALGCLICQRPAQIAHAHSGSVCERLQEPKAKGKKLQRMNFLVLPLCPYHHQWLDAGVRQWEIDYGPQAAYIDDLCVLLETDLWALAKQGAK